MAKFVVAPDSFKGSISAQGACEAIKKGIVSVIEDAEVVIKPIADGGEGTLDAMVPQSCISEAEVCGPLFERLCARYGYVNDTAVIEMACAAGLTLIPESERNAGQTTTYGVGELISLALKKGFRKIMLTVGGSATNDGGSGMLAALGARFLKSDKSQFVPTGDTLGLINEVDISGLPKAFFECEFLVATDVKNQLLGDNGATFVYAPQKGLREGQKEKLEYGMAHFAEILEKKSGKNVAKTEGCGAGGGISAPLLALADSRIMSGIDTVLEVTEFESALDGADAVITGEGKIDSQSLFGKAISGVAREGFGRNIPVYCFVGKLGDDEEKLKRLGLSEIYEIAPMASSLEDSMANADRYLFALAKQFAEEFLKKKALNP